MRTFYETDIRRRVKVLSFILAGWGIVVAARLVQVQVFGHARAKAAVLNQARSRVKIEPRRGNILDRNGEILACSLPAPSVAIRPVDKETPAQERDKVLKLKKELGLSESEVAYVLGRLRDDAGYTYVKKKIPEEVAARVMALRLPGVELEAGTRRHYPHGTLASHVLGGMSLSGESLAGIESRCDAVLKGQEGEQINYRVRGGRGYQTRVLKPPVPGKDVVLTIDATIQYIVEKELAKAVAGHRAKWGTVIVMEPRSGEILAMASWPAYDVNDYPGPDEARMNRAIEAGYEPGSTFKIVDRRRGPGAGPRRLLGALRLLGRLHQGRRAPPSPTTSASSVLSFPQVLIKSSNVGTVLFAQRLSIAECFETIKAFGFGAKTGIDLPAEAAGLVRPPGGVEQEELPAPRRHRLRGHGHGDPDRSMAMNVFATGGLLVRPRLVKGGGAPAEDGDGAARVISEKTAADLVERVFSHVVEEGTGKESRLDGYDIAGKTGTAQKWDPVSRRLHADLHRLVRRLHPARPAAPVHDRRPRRAQGRLLRRPGLRARVPGHRPPGPALSPRSPRNGPCRRGPDGRS